MLYNRKDKYTAAENCYYIQLLCFSPTLPSIFVCGTSIGQHSGGFPFGSRSLDTLVEEIIYKRLVNPADVANLL